MKKRFIGIAASALALLIGCTPANSSSESSTKEPTSTSTPDESSSDPISSSETPSSTNSSSSTDAGISVDDWDGIIRVYYRGTDGSEDGKNILPRSLSPSNPAARNVRLPVPTAHHAASISNCGR